MNSFHRQRKTSTADEYHSCEGTPHEPFHDENEKWLALLILKLRYYYIFPRQADLINQCLNGSNTSTWRPESYSLLLF